MIEFRAESMIDRSYISIIVAAWHPALTATVIFSLTKPHNPPMSAKLASLT
jgi:hypothetical protein